MQSLGPALRLLVLSAPLASSLSAHTEHAWSWPWNRKSAAAKAPEPVATVADEAPAAEAQATNNTLRSPTEPGCFMRMPSGCPKNPMRTELWRHDVWAEKKGFDDEGCMKRKGVWDGYCESQDAQMVFVAGKVSALQVDGSPSWDQSWPWSKKKAAEAKPAGETTTQAPAPQTASAKVPSQPGCYMRMLSGCPKAPMRTFLWRHDPFAEERGLEEADCLKRKSTWDKHCDSNDAEMVFVSKAAAAAAAEAAPAAEAQAAGPAENATEAAPAAEAQAADPAENATEGTLAAEAQAADPAENATEAAASKPLDKEGSVGLLQVGAARWQWPWSKPKRHIIGQEITTTAEPAVTTKAAAEQQQQPVASPLQPGCYMRIPTGCPKKSMRTQLWRHDTWAEEQGLDSLACQQRKTVWDKYCESQDALMLFVPKQ